MRPRHIALATLVMVIWGFNFVVIEVGLESFPPLLFTGLRYVVAAIPAVFFVGKPCVRWRWVLAIGLLIGVGQFGLLFIAMNLGMPAGLSSLVMQAQVPFTLVAAWLFLHEEVRRQQILGLLLAFVGIGIVAITLGKTAPPIAFALAIGAAALWALGNVSLRRSQPTDMFNLIVWTSVIPPVPMFAASLAFEGPARDLEALGNLSWTGPSWTAWGALLYLAFPATLLGWGVWGWLIRHYSAGRVAVYTLLVPIFGMSSAALVRGEEFGPARLAAAALVIAGVALAIGIRRPSLPSEPERVQDEKLIRASRS